MDNIRYDELGPRKVIGLYSKRAGFRAIVVIDNTALGPAVGGVRVAETVTMDEVLRLARTMTLKCSIAGLPHGGGKAGIVADPRDPQKELYFRVFAKQIKDLAEYIPGPDMGSDEECMAWLRDEIGRSTGLPAEIGGLPLDKLGATGFGLSICARVACKFTGLPLDGAKVAIQGYGGVGRATAKFLSQEGAVIVAVSDSKGFVHNPKGLDPRELEDVKDTSGSVTGYKKGAISKKPDGVFAVECDILVPAATADVITPKNVDSIKARIILQGANIPATLEAEALLHERGILSVPDFIANAGGVIMAAMEYARRTKKEAFDAIEDKITMNTELVLERSRAENALPRAVAEMVARERVLKAMKYQGY